VVPELEILAHAQVGQRRVPLYVNKKTGTGHLDRDCEWLASVPDGAVRLSHANSSEPIRLRMCPTCSPTMLRLALE